jgi:hypothetical protein
VHFRLADQAHHDLRIQSPRSGIRGISSRSLSSAAGLKAR